MVTLSSWVSLAVSMHGKCRNPNKSIKAREAVVGRALRERTQANCVLLRSRAGS
jgi:hypothetical protein